MDNTLFKEESKLIFLTPIDRLDFNGKTFYAIGATYNSQNLFDILDIEAFDGKATIDRDCIYFDLFRFDKKSPSGRRDSA